MEKELPPPEPMRLAPPTECTDKILDWMNSAVNLGILSDVEARVILHIMVDAINEGIYLRANTELGMYDNG